MPAASIRTVPAVFSDRSGSCSNSSTLPPRQPPPSGCGSSEILWRKFRRFVRARIDVAGFSDLSQPFERLPVVVETLGIVLAALRVQGQLPLRVGDSSERQVDTAELAMNLARAVLFVLPDGGLEMRQGFVVTAALPLTPLLVAVTVYGPPMAVPPE